MRGNNREKCTILNKRERVRGGVEDGAPFEGKWAEPRAEHCWEAASGKPSSIRGGGFPMNIF